MALGFADTYEQLASALDEIEASAQAENEAQRDSQLREAIQKVCQAVRYAYRAYEARFQRRAVSEGGEYTWARNELQAFVQIPLKEYVGRKQLSGDALEKEARAWLTRAKRYADKLSALSDNMTSRVDADHEEFRMRNIGARRDWVNEFDKTKKG